jgi:hypothetical protein
MTKDTDFYQCHYCHKKYRSERSFIKHKCKMMVRDDNLRTSNGQSAWLFYQQWMRLQRKRVPDDRTFLKSQYYQSFNKFAVFVKKLNLSSPDIYIKIMIDLNYPPTMWTMDEVYVKYLEHLDRKISPIDHAKITAQTLDELADIFECSVNEVFEHLNGNETIELIRQRKLTPWILLHSSKFFQHLKKINDENKEQFIILETIIRPKYWAIQFQKKPNVVKFMKEIVTGLEI